MIGLQEWVHRSFLMLSENYITSQVAVSIKPFYLKKDNVGTGELGFRKKMFLLKMVVFVVFLLVFLPQVVCMISSTKCSINDPLPFLHKQYQSGDLIVVDILSQIYIFYAVINFTERPSKELFEDIV